MDIISKMMINDRHMANLAEHIVLTRTLSLSHTHSNVCVRALHPLQVEEPKKLPWLKNKHFSASFKGWQDKKNTFKRQKNCRKRILSYF